MKLIYPLFYPSNLDIYESVMRIEYSFESHIDDVEDEEGDLKKASHFCCLQFGCWLYIIGYDIGSKMHLVIFILLV